MQLSAQILPLAFLSKEEIYYERVPFKNFQRIPVDTGCNLNVHKSSIYALCLLGFSQNY